jgi:hypothetical protein
MAVNPTNEMTMRSATRRRQPCNGPAVGAGMNQSGSRSSAPAGPPDAKNCSSGMPSDESSDRRRPTLSCCRRPSLG